MPKYELTSLRLLLESPTEEMLDDGLIPANGTRWFRVAGSNEISNVGLFVDGDAGGSVDFDLNSAISYACSPRESPLLVVLGNK